MKWKVTFGNKKNMYAVQGVRRDWIRKKTEQVKEWERSTRAIVEMREGNRSKRVCGGKNLGVIVTEIVPKCQAKIKV